MQIDMLVTIFQIPAEQKITLLKFVRINLIDVVILKLRERQVPVHLIQVQYRYEGIRLLRYDFQWAHNLGNSPL